jgi:lysozyme
MPTIGVGHLLTQDERTSGKIWIKGQRIKWAEGLDPAQIEDLLVQDLLPVEETVNKLVRVPITQTQFDALVMFTFNCGREALAGSTLLKKLNAGEYEAVPDQLRRGVMVDGVPNAGLKNRREAEVKVWLT